MVGIAGEDDLNAPPGATTDPTEDRRAADRGLPPNSSVAPAPVRSSQFRTGSPAARPIPEKLSTDRSAAAAAQLTREIETLSEEDLQSRAIAILKAKNRLSADDAKRIEVAFAARMTLPDALHEALMSEEPPCASTNPEPTQLSSTLPESVKVLQPRGRPKKVKVAAERVRMIVSGPDNLYPLGGCGKV